MPTVRQRATEILGALVKRPGCGLCGGTGRSRDRGMREPVCDICSRDGAARLAMLEAAGLRVVESESSRG